MLMTLGLCARAARRLPSSLFGRAFAGRDMSRAHRRSPDDADQAEGDRDRPCQALLMVAGLNAERLRRRTDSRPGVYPAWMSGRQPGRRQRRCGPSSASPSSRLILMMAPICGDLRWHFCPRRARSDAHPYEPRRLESRSTLDHRWSQSRVLQHEDDRACW